MWCLGFEPRSRYILCIVSTSLVKLTKKKLLSNVWRRCDIFRRIWSLVFNPSLMDAYIWPHQKKGIYSTKSGHDWLISHHNLDTQVTNSWSWIWRLKVPEKFKFLIWLACHNAVPTLSLLHHRNMVNSAICSKCGVHEETLFHSLRDCNFSIAIWNKIGFSY